MRLSATNICWSAGGAEILRDVSLVVEEGEFFGIIGPNGSGKTTLMSLLSGIRRPQVGSVNLQGIRLTEIQRRDVAKCIAFVEQHAETSEKITARQTVELGRTPYLGPLSPWSQRDDEIVDVALHHVDMSHLADRLWHTLSGGERQRLHIARALAQQPRVLLLDEPTNHLDIGHQLELLELVGQLNLTVIAALHDLNHAATFCDRIALMQAGHLVAVGRPSDVLTADRIRDVFGVEAEVSHIGESCHIRFLPRRFVERPQERAFRAVS